MKEFTVKSGRLTAREIAATVKVLQNEGVIVCPTDTVYGLGCIASSQSAVHKIYEIKGRSYQDKVALLVDSVDKIEKYAQVGQIEREFINKYLPGPVTVIIRLKDKYISDIVPAAIGDKNGTGWRVIELDYMNKILQGVGEPLVMTSANRSGVGVMRANKKFVYDQLKDQLEKIDLWIDAGDLGEENAPSAVVNLTQTPFSIVRQGYGFNRTKN